MWGHGAGGHLNQGIDVIKAAYGANTAPFGSNDMLFVGELAAEEVTEVAAGSGFRSAVQGVPLAPTPIRGLDYSFVCVCAMTPESTSCTPRVDKLYAVGGFVDCERQSVSFGCAMCPSESMFRSSF